MTGAEKKEGGAGGFRFATVNFQYSQALHLDISYFLSMSSVWSFVVVVMIYVSSYPVCRLNYAASNYGKLAL
jgi:hypothetical protein